MPLFCQFFCLELSHPIDPAIGMEGGCEDRDLHLSFPVRCSHLSLRMAVYPAPSSLTPSFDFPLARSTNTMGISFILALLRCARNSTSWTIAGPGDVRLLGPIFSNISLLKHR